MKYPPTGTALLIGNGEIKSLSGKALPNLQTEDYKILTGQRPTIRKVKDGVICSAKVDDTRHIAHYYSKLPKDVGTPALVKETIAAAAAYRDKAKAEETDHTQNIFLTALSNAQPLRPKHRLTGFAGLLSDHGFSEAVVLFQYQNKKIKRLYYSDMRFENANSELKFLITQYLRSDDPVHGIIEDLDADLMAQKLGGYKLCLVMPETNSGIGILSIDTKKQDLEIAQNNLNALYLLTPKSRLKLRFTKWVQNLAIMASLIALLFYLFQTAPVYISAPVQSKGSDNISMSLPFPAILDQAHVLSGDYVEAGQPLVTLRSDEIKQALEQERLQLNLEGLNAEEALEEQNYNQYQIAQARQAISQARVKQLNTQIDQLSVRAPQSGRVVFALPQSDVGSTINTGLEIARLQTTDSFEVVINIASSDAYLLHEGQFGEVTFKGVTNQVFMVEIITGPTQVFNAQTNEYYLESLGRIKQTSGGQLLTGLEGYVKIEVSSAPRIVGLTRQAVNYIRFQIWKILGLNI